MDLPSETLPQGNGSAAEVSSGLVSILVLCCGQLEHTRLCVPSLLHFSRPPFEIIGVESGNLDGTFDYWLGVQAAAPVHIEIVRSPADMDLPLALQEGLAHTRGEFIVLLHNDTVVTDSWLNQLTGLATMNPIIGMVAPMTNYGPGKQLVGPVPYRLGRTKDEPPTNEAGPDYFQKRIEAVNRFAKEWREKYRGQWFETDRLGGGCVLLKRAILKAVGPLEGAPLNFYDPEALSQRVLQAGFRLACCRDLFVHWSGSRTFIERSTESSSPSGKKKT
jgi:GT2 family glycosyltransferase